jgi:hypothetical protein
LVAIPGARAAQCHNKERTMTERSSFMSYDPGDHLVTSNDITVGIGLYIALLACLAIF